MSTLHEEQATMEPDFRIRFKVDAKYHAEIVAKTKRLQDITRVTVHIEKKTSEVIIEGNNKELVDQQEVSLREMIAKLDNQVTRTISINASLHNAIKEMISGEKNRDEKNRDQKNRDEKNRDLKNRDEKNRNKFKDVKVVFPINRGKKLITIRGPQQQVEEAMVQLQQFADELQQSGKKSNEEPKKNGDSQFEAPKYIYSYINGPGGHYIIQICKKFKVKILRSRFGDLDVFNICGSEETVQASRLPFQDRISKAKDEFQKKDLFVKCQMPDEFGGKEPQRLGLIIHELRKKNRVTTDVDKLKNEIQIWGRKENVQNAEQEILKIFDNFKASSKVKV